MLFSKCISYFSRDKRPGKKQCECGKAHLYLISCRENKTESQAAPWWQECAAGTSCSSRLGGTGNIEGTRSGPRL